MKKLRFAIIGTSSIAPYHVYALQNNPWAEPVCVFSRDYERAKYFADRHGLVPARSYEEILADMKIDAVDIVTEPTRHAALVLAALRKGKHILVEKPLTTDISLAEEILRAAKNSPVKLSVISKKRFDPILMAIKNKLDAGLIGEPFMAELQLLWKRSDGYYQHGNGWRGKEGSVLLNQAIHWLDLAVWYFGPPSKVWAKTKKINKNISTYDTAVCCLEFSSGLLLNLCCSTAVYADQPEAFKIFGRDGVLSYNETSSLVKVGLLKRLKDKIFRSLGRARLNILNSPLQRQVDDFVGAIINDVEPKVSVQDVYNTLSIINECEQLVL